MGQKRVFSWNLDATMASLGYEDTINPTTGVTYTYDPVYPRIASMTDGLGATSFSYYPVDGTTPGAGMLYTVDGPFADDTLTYSYDALGRLTGRALDVPGGRAEYTHASV